MRILLITQDAPADNSEAMVSGAVKNPHYVSCELQARGHRIDVLSFDRHRSARATATPSVRRFSTSFMRLFPRTLWLNLRSIFYAIAARRRFDIIQSHHPHFTMQFALLKQLGVCRTPLIIKAHGTAAPELKANRYGGFRGIVLRINAWLHQRADRWVFSIADRVVSSSAFQIEEMDNAYKIDRARIRLIYNGSLPISVKPQRGTPPRLLFVGRVVPKKGIDRFVELARTVANSMDIQALLVLGHSRHIEDAACYRQCVVPILDDPLFTVRFDVPEREMPAIFAGSNVLLVPSSGYESIPTVIYEAHAAGTAVFATYAWGIPEVLRPSFALTGDIAVDAERIASFLRSTTTSGHAPPSQSYPAGHHDWSRLILDYEALYAELIRKTA